jgi:hypothetical protein
VKTQLQLINIIIIIIIIIIITDHGGPEGDPGARGEWVVNATPHCILRTFM